MEFNSINIQGTIISSEILGKIRSEDIKYQTATDFGLERKTSVRNEIGVAWAAARAHYTAFKLRAERLKEGETGTSETRNSWMLPLLREMGYDVEKAPVYTQQDSQKTYAISHHAVNLGNFPIHIVGYREDLDKRSESGTGKISPHALTQEYLNNTDHVYALVTNGRHLRLLRDATRLVRLSYLEFDLRKMMEEEHYSDFAVLYRLLHATRLPKDAESTESSFIEYYHQESLASGSRIREKLSKAVEHSIVTLANGFLVHTSNEGLIDSVKQERVTPDTYYLQQLRLIYRMLFLIVTEERNLIYPETLDKDLQRKRKIYYDYYSIERLRKLAGKLHWVDGKKTDLWESLKATFALFENGTYGERLGIRPLGSGIFSPDALGVLNDCKLDNASLLRVIRSLTFFENDNKQQVRVNYSDLDVEEFGSVYEGLLEYDAELALIGGMPTFRFKEGTGRSSSGSHYTPEELVKPLIKHSLDYLIEDRLKEKDPEAALLRLKVADVACGSGHILLSAARRIAFEVACIRETKAAGGKVKVEQPSPKYIRAATRDVIRHCIYGVDKNPLAVELCKVALWLEAHNPGEPLNFLDHHIKCGDAIVGLAHRDELENGIADEAFKTLPGDDKDIAKTWRDKNIKERKERVSKALQLKAEFEKSTENSVQEAMAEYKTFCQLPETTPEEIERKAKAYKKFIDGKGFTFLKAMADTQVAQFFIPKTEANKDNLMTDADYRLILSGYRGWQDRKVAKATAVAHEQRFFHWFIEFPEVFSEGGFDCLLGNPPYLGGKKISGNYGLDFLEVIHFYFSGVGGQSDLIAYFIRRISQLIKINSYFSIISTNTISEGDTREGSLEHLISVSKGYEINFAIKSTIWPGVANLYVALFSIYKGVFNGTKFLNGKIVQNINSYFLDEENNVTPFTLTENQEKLFRGVDFGGTGFIIDDNQRNFFISVDLSNSEVISPLINGDEINNDPNQNASRWIINFKNYELDIAQKYQLPLNHVFENVKPYRDEQNDKTAKEKWWIYKRNKLDLYNKIEKKEYCYVTAFTSKFLFYSRVKTNRVYSNALNILAEDSDSFFAILQSTIHFEWARKYGSKLKNDLRYTPTDCFETFPFPQYLNPKQGQQLETIGESYHEHRRQHMLGMQLGLTKTYNLFHSNAVTAKGVDESDKQVAALQKHLEKTPDTISFEDAINGILKLRELHVQMDEAVLDAYGWRFDSAQRPDIQLRHDFYEVDYLPENDRTRYTIHPDARKEVLKRLLALNHKIYEQEIREGKHKLEDAVKFFKEKGQEVPNEVLAHYQKTKSSGTTRAPKKKDKGGSLELWG